MFYQICRNHADTNIDCRGEHDAGLVVNYVLLIFCQVWIKKLMERIPELTFDVLSFGYIH